MHYINQTDMGVEPEINETRRWFTFCGPKSLQRIILSLSIWRKFKRWLYYFACLCSVSQTNSSVVLVGILFRGYHRADVCYTVDVSEPIIIPMLIKDLRNFSNPTHIHAVSSSKKSIHINTEPPWKPRMKSVMNPSSI
jgi:hypothetical protein